MSGEEKRNEGLLGESGNERRRSQLAPPDLYVTALFLDSTAVRHRGACRDTCCRRGGRPDATDPRRAPATSMQKCKGQSWLSTLSNEVTVTIDDGPPKRRAR